MPLKGLAARRGMSCEMSFDTVTKNASWGVSEMAEQKARSVRTTLDSLPYGEFNDDTIKVKANRVPAPEGVTGGMLLRDVTLIAWPCLLELILSQLTSMADQIMVGRLPGKEGLAALSAVALAAQPKFLVMTMIMSMNVGTTATIAMYRGRQDRDMANRTFRQTVFFNFFIAIAMTILGLVFCRPFINIVAGSGVSQEALDGAYRYFDIQMYGFVPFALTMTATAALRGIGETKISLVYNTVANVVNVIFNYIMIYGKFGCPKLGVAGASWATIIGQCVAFFIAYSRLVGKKHYLNLSFRDGFSIDTKLLSRVVNIGIPSMIEQLFMRTGMIIFTRAVSGLGDTMYATHQICMNIQSLSFMTGQAFGTSATTLIGQSLGKLRYDMAVNYMKWTRRAGMVVAVILACIFSIFGRQIVGVYNTTPEVIDTGGKVLFFVALMQPIQSAQFITAGGLRGAGDTKYSAMVTAITVFGIRSILGNILINRCGLSIWGAWIAILTDQAVRSVLIMLRYNTGIWAKNAVNRNRANDLEAAMEATID